VLSDGWAQSIRVILEDIDLSDENLLELKQFRPNENVVVEITPVQASFFDQEAPANSQTNGRVSDPDNLEKAGNEEEIIISLAEEEEAEDNGSVVKEWLFDAESSF
jgi:hypothetical protein